jgi:hypothetical protein
MGLFKRFFSLGSKKSKNKDSSSSSVTPSENGTVTHAATLNETKNRSRSIDDEANRLLRSSSAHYKVVKEFDYSSLPPIPHPINRVLDSAVAASTPDLLTQEPAIPRAPKSSYTVTVYPRQKHTATDFPHAYHEDSVSSDSSRILALRSDPSVASLLNMFDNKGQIPSQVFSNSPPRVGKPQLQRNGSTLRQLLGDPPSGDISWAERFLGERDSMDSENTSSTSCLRTPADLESNFEHSTSDIQASKTFDSQNWNQSSPHIPDPPSPQTELDTEASRSTISQEGDVAEPQIVRRASQIFSFLYAKPSFINAPSVEKETRDDESCNASNVSSPSTSSNPQGSTPDTSLPDCDIYQEPATPLDMCCDSEASFIEELGQTTAPNPENLEPITFIVTAPTPRVKNCQEGFNSRIPVRSPGRASSSVRPAHARRLSSHPYAPPLVPSQEEDADRSAYDPFTAIPKRHRRNRHKASASMGDILAQKRNFPPVTVPFSLGDAEKNTIDSPPSTPVRSRALNLKRQNPSPASSTELSPVGRQLMVNLRHQRMQARALERERLKEGLKR